MRVITHTRMEFRQMHDNTNLNRAISTQDDEFYTSLRDIEQEMRHYEPQLRGKRIYSNCDGQQSNFVKYFEMHGDRLGIIWHRWSQDDYAASHNIDTLHEADIIITNPPFTLMREYVATLIGCRKRFLIVAPVHAITKKSIFPRFKKMPSGSGTQCTECNSHDRMAPPKACLRVGLPSPASHSQPHHQHLLPMRLSLLYKVRASVPDNSPIDIASRISIDKSNFVLILDIL